MAQAEVWRRSANSKIVKESNMAKEATVTLNCYYCKAEIKVVKTVGFAVCPRCGKQNSTRKK